jgi:hypothetical protein
MLSSRALALSSKTFLALNILKERRGAKNKEALLSASWLLVRQTGMVIE